MTCERARFDFPIYVGLTCDLNNLQLKNLICLDGNVFSHCFVVHSSPQIFFSHVNLDIGVDSIANIVKQTMIWLILKQLMKFVELVSGILFHCQVWVVFPSSDIDRRYHVGLTFPSKPKYNLAAYVTLRRPYIYFAFYVIGFFDAFVDLYVTFKECLEIWSTVWSFHLSKKLYLNFLLEALISSNVIFFTLGAVDDIGFIRS